ncbi:AAA family ATPase [Yinghuangia sp. YIM S09857]|uniref:AAA family ATPase n=1 Tax=Yinghuangia sp. YIM S09857 TaxID=3436929 RepID=UPI003F53949F
MITRLEIDGFKSLVGVELDVLPSLVLVGPNGAGKSNVFDALRLVADCVEDKVERAFARQARGHGPDLFHRTAAGGDPPPMRIVVGMLLETPFGPMPARLRLEAEWRDGELFPGEAAVWFSALRNRSWMTRLGLSSAWTEAIDRTAAELRRREERDHIRLGRGPVPGLLWESVTRECLTWRPLELRPSAMRDPVPGTGSDGDLIRPDGSNLASVLDRIQKAGLLDDLNIDLAALISGVREVDPVFDRRRFEYDFDVVQRDGRRSAPSVLSEGTLRVLALLAAAYDPHAPGVLAVEELENGLHPSRLAEVVRRLRRDVADYQDAPPPTGPMRQLLMTTHSPVLVSAFRDAPDATLVFVERSTRFAPGGVPGDQATIVRPVRASPPPDADLGTYATDFEVRRLLETVPGGER